MFVTATSDRAPARPHRSNAIGDAGRSVHSQSVIVSRCHADIPVDIGDGRVVNPWIVLILDMVDGSVLGAALGDERYVEAAIASSLSTRARGREIAMDIGIATALDGFDASAANLVTTTDALAATARALGGRVGSIGLVNTATCANPGRTPGPQRRRPLRMVEARRIIRDQLAIHNAARGAPAPMIAMQHAG